MGAPSARFEYAAYALFALLGVAPALLQPGATVGDGVDAYGTHWFYWWARFCIEHGGDPSTTNLFFFPEGKDIFAHTGNNLVDAVLSVPFQWALGPTFYQPIFVLAIQFGNAVLFRPLARYVLGDTFAAFAATLLWQINPFILFELTAGRPTQAMVWFVPPAVLYFLRTAREPGLGNPVRLGLAMGLAAWTYWFNGYFLALFLVPLAAFELRGARAWARLALGVGICGLLVAPGVATMATAYATGQITGLDIQAGAGLFDAPRPGGNAAPAELQGLWRMEMQGAPMLLQPAWGLPLIAAMALATGMRRWIPSILLVIFVGLGPVVADVVMPTYMFLYRYLPFFARLWFPYRMVGVAFVGIALLIGAGVARAGRPRAALATLVLLGLGGQAVSGVWPLNTHDATAPRMLTALRREGGAVIFVPFKLQHDGVMWQTRFQLPTFGGMAESSAVFWPKDHRARLGNRFVAALRGAAMSPAFAMPVMPGERAAIERMGFRWIVMRLDLMQGEFVHQGELRGVAIDTADATTKSVEVMTEVVGSAPVGIDGPSVLWDLEGRYAAAPEFAVSTERILAQRAAAPAPRHEAALERLGRMGASPERIEDAAGPKPRGPGRRPAQ